MAKANVTNAKDGKRSPSNSRASNTAHTGDR